MLRTSTTTAKHLKIDDTAAINMHLYKYPLKAPNSLAILNKQV